MNEILKSDYIKDYALVRESLYEGEVKRTKDSIKFESDINTIEVISVGKYEYLRYLNKLNLNYDNVNDKAILINNGIGYENGKNIIFSILDYKVGDRINLSNAIDKKDYSFLLSSVTYERPKGYENDYGMSYLVVSDEVMDSIRKRGYVSLYIESTNPDKLQDDIEKIFEDKDGLYNVSNIDSNIKQVKSIYTIVAIFLYGFIIVISLIGITNIFNTISTNMALRKNEFATLTTDFILY